VRAFVQDVLRENRHERRCAAEEHGEEVERDGAEQKARAAHVAQAGEDGFEREGFAASTGPRLHHADQSDEGEQAEQRKAVDDWGAVEAGEAASEEAAESERKQQAAEHGAGGVSDLEDSRAPGYGVDEVLFRDERGDEGTGGGAAETSAGSDEEEDQIYRPDAADAMQRKPEQGDGRECLHGVASEDDAAAIVAVGDVAGGEYEDQAGKKERETGVAERERGVSDLVDLPGDADALRLRTEHAEQPPRLVETEVARTPCGGA
jgi:hypothetical protein